MKNLLILLVVVVAVAGLWKTLAKAGMPGWGSVIPFYNLYLVIKLAGRPGWWLLLMFIPLVNIVFNVIVLIGLGKKFGYGAAFGWGLFLLPFIFFPILGFGQAAYKADAV